MRLEDGARGWASDQSHLRLGCDTIRAVMLRMRGVAAELEEAE